MNIQYRNSQNSLLTSLTHLFRKSYVNNYNSRRCGQKTPRATNSLRRRAKTKGSPQLEDEGEKNPSLNRNYKISSTQQNVTCKNLRNYFLKTFSTSYSRLLWNYEPKNLRNLNLVHECEQKEIHSKTYCCLNSRIKFTSKLVTLEHINSLTFWNFIIHTPMRTSYSHF